MKYYVGSNQKLVNSRLIKFAEKWLMGYIRIPSVRILISSVVKEEKEVLQILEALKDSITINKK